jgi:hypothetical protein
VTTSSGGVTHERLRVYRVSHLSGNLGPDGTEVERFGITNHPGDLSWLVLTRLEERLAPIVGENWTEKKR